MRYVIGNQKAVKEFILQCSMLESLEYDPAYEIIGAILRVSPEAQTQPGVFEAEIQHTVYNLTTDPVLANKLLDEAAKLYVIIINELSACSLLTGYRAINLVQLHPFLVVECHQ